MDDPVGILWKCLVLVKLEWLGYRTVKKLWRYIKPFSSDTGWYRNVTDRRTDGQTDRFAISISRVVIIVWFFFIGLCLAWRTTYYKEAAGRCNVYRYWRTVCIMFTYSIAVTGLHCSLRLYTVERTYSGASRHNKNIVGVIVPAKQRRRLHYTVSAATYSNPDSAVRRS